jgi:hypothetical protein
VNVLANLVRVVTATVGTGTVTLGAAAAGWLTFAQGGLTTGAVVTYAIEDANGAHEIGRGTYTAAGLTLSRDQIYRSTGAGNNTAISLSGSAQVYVTAAAEDLVAGIFTGQTFTSPTLAGTIAVTGAVNQTQPLPALLGTVAQGGASRGVAVLGNYAYATNQATVQTFEIFDITVPTAPVKLGGLDMPAQALCSPVVAGQIAYVGINSVTVAIQIVDVSNPKAPVLLRGLNNTGTTANVLALSGNYLYSGQGGGAGNTLRIWDVSDPANPVARGVLALTGTVTLQAIVLQGKYAFVSGTQSVAGTAGLHIVDISDPTTPVLVATYNAVASVRGILAAGKYLYITESVAASGLEVIDISDPTAPVQVAVFTTTGLGSSVTNPILAGNYLFFPNTSANGIQTINISNPAVPVSVGGSPTVLGTTGMAISGNKLYIAANATLRIYDLFGIDAPAAWVGALDTGTLNVDGQSFFAGDIYAQRGLVIGQGGINSRGPISASGLGAIPVSAIFVGLVCIGGGTSAFPALKRAGTVIQARLGDDSAYGGFEAGTLGVGAPSGHTPADITQSNANAYASNVISSTGARAAIINSDQTDNNVSRLVFSTTNSAASLQPTAGISVIHTAHLAGAETGVIAFQTSQAGTRAERGRIDGNNWGVGSNFSAKAPQAMLHVGSLVATARAYSLYTDAANGTWAYMGDWGKTSNVAVYGTDMNGTGVARDVSVLRGGVEQIRLASLGIGMGTAVPAGSLHIYSANGGQLILDQSSTFNTGVIQLTLGDGTKTINNAATKGWQWLARSETNGTRPGQLDLAYWSGVTATVLAQLSSTNVTINVPPIFSVGGVTQLDYGVTNAAAWTLASAAKITTATGATEGAVLNVDAAVGQTITKFGPLLPLYMIQGNPGFGFNGRYTTQWLYGKGSVLGTHYAGALAFFPGTGELWGFSTLATGAADSVATLSSTFVVSRTGQIGFGQGVAFSSAFPMLNANGTTAEIKLGDNSAYAPLRASTVTADLHAGAAVEHRQAQVVLSGGGTVTWSAAASSKLKWTTRFIAAPLAYSAGNSGFIALTQPVANIPAGQVYNGVARTADANGVLLNPWEALYAVHTVGGNTTAILYYIVIYSTVFAAPSNWILIAAINGDNSSCKLGTGAILQSGGSISQIVSADPRLTAEVAPYARGLDACRALQPIQFRHNGKAGTDPALLHYGLAGDTAEKVLPELVSRVAVKMDHSDALDDDEPTLEVATVDSTPLIYLLMNAVNELSAKVDALI